MVKMTDLLSALEGLGFERPQTLLQSGNVVFGATGNVESIEESLSSECKAKLGLSLGIQIRDLPSWRNIVSANPFPGEAISDPSHLLLTLLSNSPDAKEIEAIQERVPGPEKIRVGDRCLYVTYPDGVGKSTIGKTPGWNKLTKDATARNWNTVLKLLELAERHAESS
jgi:uncharacterized protein (DUF1697 family)